MDCMPFAKAFTYSGGSFLTAGALTTAILIFYLRFDFTSPFTASSMGIWAKKMRSPLEKFISTTAELQAVNKWTKNLEIPENVKVAASRIPKNAVQRSVLKKELRQAGILARAGCYVYLIPERGGYGERLKDAVVNGELFEFRNVTGNARTLEWEFNEAKKKGNDTNVFISVDKDVSLNEARRRISLVLNRHPEYTGKIFISINGKNLYFGNTINFR
jgi:hypothetical protein